MRKDKKVVKERHITTVDLSAKLNKDLEKLIKQRGGSKSGYIRMALKALLESLPPVD